MSIRRWFIGVSIAALVGGLVAGAALAQGKEVFVPLLVYRTGPYAPSGIPIANGLVDYFSLINERDGGVNGVKLVWEECETQYDTKQGVECYERLKGKGGGAVVINPYSTGITYQLIPKAPVDKIPVFSMGYGMTAAADGRWFPWVFNFPTTYWSQASAVIRYIGQQEGGPDKLKGKKIAHIYHNSPYGKEANPTLEELAQRLGFELTLLAVDHPGQEQKSTWLQVRRLNPDWIFMSGWGVMNQVAIKEAAAIGFKMDHFIGNWWSSSDADVIPAGDGAKGYKGATFHAPGTDFKVHQEIFRVAVRQGQGRGQEGGRRRGALQPRHRQRHVHRGGHPHGHGEVRQQAADGRADPLGLREPEPDRQAARGARHEGLHPPGQGDVRGPRGQRPGPVRAVGRQEVEHRLGVGARRCGRWCARRSRRPPSRKARSSATPCATAPRRSRAAADPVSDSGADRSSRSTTSR